MGHRTAIQYYKKELWIEENEKYRRPHYRLEKCARLVNKVAGSTNCDLLDIGCGPGTLEEHLSPNIRYFGIDLALAEPKPNLMEVDVVQSPIQFQARTFDVIVAQGLFEYLGEHQNQKLAEIAEILRPEGRFVTSYVNFGHRKRNVYCLYNNVQSLGQFRKSLGCHFALERYFPTSYNWRHDEPSRPLLKAVNMRLNLNLPAVASKLAVEYFFICRPLQSGAGTARAPFRAGGNL